MPPEPDKLTDLIKTAETLIEKVNNLYNQFFSGSEKRPPVESRKRLDQTMSRLSHMPKPTAAVRFQFQSTQSRYITYRDRWEKKLRDREK